MYQGGVTFSETEEKCPRSSHITFTGVLKALVQGEEVERTRKRKRATSELQGEVVSIAKERLETEEIGEGGLKITQSNQCSPPRLKKIQFLLKAEQKERAGQQESSTTTLFSLLTKMREEMKIRDE